MLMPLTVSSIEAQRFIGLFQLKQILMFSKSWFQEINLSIMVCDLLYCFPYIFLLCSSGVLFCSYTNILLAVLLQLFIVPMQFPQSVYAWLVDSHIIDNQGERDNHGYVYFAKHQCADLLNGYLVGQLLKQHSAKINHPVPQSLSSLKADHSKSTKQTNWNFIWLSLPELDLTFDPRIKELILQGENALIVEFIKQLYERDSKKAQHSRVAIRNQVKTIGKGGRPFDVKRIDFGKNASESESPLQFLILLLKESLAMTLQQILGLFTNQNKYLALIIVTGVNGNFQPIVLFYSLLHKHSQRLGRLYRQNGINHDSMAILHALKAGLTSKHQQVALLTINLFDKINDLYPWFISQDAKAANTLMLGVKRHSSLRQKYWKLLLKIIKGKQLEFFTKYYSLIFASNSEMIEITSFILCHLAQSQLKQILIDVGVLDSWMEMALNMSQKEVEAQISAFNFLGQMMIYFPSVVENNEQSLDIFSRNWKKRGTIDFLKLSGEIINVLIRLGDKKSSMARKIYTIVAQITREVGPGDKRDYLVELFKPLISKFPTIPSQLFISNLKSSLLSPSQLLLVCDSIETIKHPQSLAAIGNFLKQLFIQNPLINYYVAPLLLEISEKLITDGQPQFVITLIEQVLYAYAVTFVKYRPKPRQMNQLYFGSSSNSDHLSKQQLTEERISKKWKDLYLTFASNLLNLIHTTENHEFKESSKQKVIKVDAYIKFHNSKLPSKEMRQRLFNRFGIRIPEDKNQPSEANKLRGTNNQVDPIEKYQKITSQERRFNDQKQLAAKQKKYLDYKRKRVNKQLQNSNLVRGQVNVAQVSEDGLFQSIVHQPNELHLVHMEQLQQREIDSINFVLKRYHRVLKHLFWLYTGTKFSTINIQLIEDNQKRKQTLTSVQLIQFLKDYKKFYLTSSNEVSNMVRDINIRLLSKRNVSQLDFAGFEMFIVQFCYLNMTIPHQITHNNITTNQNTHKTTVETQKVTKYLKDQPIGYILLQFFKELKATFVCRKEKIDIFEDLQDIVLSKQQQEEVKRLTSELRENHSFILPTGFKKVVEKSIDLSHKISKNISGLPQSYEAAYEILDQILSREPLNMHVVQPIAQQIDVYKVKAVGLASPQKALPRERAMSTLVNRSKSPLLTRNPIFPKDMISVLRKMKPEDKATGQQVAEVLLELVQKVSSIITVEINKPKEKSEASAISKPKRRATSSLKIEEKQHMKIKAINRRQQQREEAKKRQKQEERKRREHVAKFLEEQRIKMMQKKQKEQEQKQKKARQQQEKLAIRKANIERFRPFHQHQVEKIKKIQQEALQKQRQQRQSETQQRQKQSQKHRQLRQKIEERQRNRSQIHREIENSLADLLASQPIKATFRTYEPNLRALYQFLLSHTHLSLTQKKHNNEIVFDTWKYFLTVFELSPLLIQGKEGVQMFKQLTKQKEVAKDYLVGLTFKDFQEALLRIAVKFKAFFNAVSQRIKDPHFAELQSVQKEEKLEDSRTIQKDNQFDVEEIRIKEILKENDEGKSEFNEYGDISKANQKTLKGLIHYLRMPKNLAGQTIRLREVQAYKPKTLINKIQRLKEKLKEDYWMIQSRKKKKQEKNTQNIGDINPTASFAIQK